MRPCDRAALNAMSGLTVGYGRATCGECGRSLSPGDDVTAYTHRRRGGRWETAVYCGECAAYAVPEPSVGVDEWVLTASLSAAHSGVERQPRVVLSGPEVVSRSFAGNDGTTVAVGHRDPGV